MSSLQACVDDIADALDHYCDKCHPVARFKHGVVQRCIGVKRMSDSTKLVALRTGDNCS